MARNPMGIEKLAAQLAGEVLTDLATQRLYATDASPFQQLPMGVVYPRNETDCVIIVHYAAKHHVALIPRAAGTSLAGQCVGDGLVVDISRHMNNIIEIDTEKRIANVQPGVIAADLNDQLRPHGLMFAPDPSTANRCTIGGMLGNNAWGVHAPAYGTTRDNIEVVSVILSDGSSAQFGPLSESQRDQKLALETLEGEIYRQVSLIVDSHLQTIEERYPTYRGIPNNMGYALDVLATQQPWNPQGPLFNLAPFMCGSEGTLALATEIAVKLVPLPGRSEMICAHFGTLDEALSAVEPAVAASASAVELLDRQILNLARSNPEQQVNRFWIDGDPAAVLIIEFYGHGNGNNDSDADLESRSQGLIDHYRSASLGYACARIDPAQHENVWALRKAGLGLLMGKKGQRKAVTGFEDTAVALQDLPAYTRDLLSLFEASGKTCVVYGSASRGLLHLRPLLDLSDHADRQTYKRLLIKVAELVAQYRGSISAKHGDGCLRAPLLKRVLGENIVGLLHAIKETFDPRGIFNPGKILDSEVANFPLRAATVEQSQSVQSIEPYFDGASSTGLLGAASRCHGAGVCLKSAGRGTMCPSYMATRNEMHNTRGRANLLRQALSSVDPVTALTDQSLFEALDLCLGCKGCQSECPANVDMARLKSEFLHHYYQHHGQHHNMPWRSRWLCRFQSLSRVGSLAPGIFNNLLNTTLAKRILGLHKVRALPPLATERFSRQTKISSNPEQNRTVILINDPFTEYYDPQIGHAALVCLERLGYSVHVTECLSSGRVEISQGLLQEAQRTIIKALDLLYPLVQHAGDSVAVIGLEPSEILTFRDEAPDLMSDSKLRLQAQQLARQVTTFEEFIVQHCRQRPEASDLFSRSDNRILLHVHCHQKAICGIQPALEALQLASGNKIEAIPSGCCGMAGVFGYEAEHYMLSKQIAELVLLPAVRQAPDDSVIVATGFSCRHQIADLAGVEALHPAQVLANALR